MNVAGPAFRKFTELVKLSKLDIYGKPSSALLEQTHRKAQLLGNASVVVNELHAGFTRIEPGLAHRGTQAGS